MKQEISETWTARKIVDETNQSKKSLGLDKPSNIAAQVA